MFGCLRCAGCGGALVTQPVCSAWTFINIDFVLAYLVLAAPHSEQQFYELRLADRIGSGGCRAAADKPEFALSCIVHGAVSSGVRHVLVYRNC